MLCHYLDSETLGAERYSGKLDNVYKYTTIKEEWTCQPRRSVAARELYNDSNNLARIIHKLS
jgi:hypothetical protein